MNLETSSVVLGKKIVVGVTSPSWDERYDEFSFLNSSDRLEQVA